MNEQTRALLVMALIGIVAGWLASWIVGGGGIFRYLVTGIIGSFVGGYLFKMLGLRLGIGNVLVEQVLVSTAGAIVVVLLARTFLL